MKNRFNLFSAAMLMVAGILSSCATDERELDAPVPDSEKLTIKIAVPGNSRPATRALGATEEYAVSEIAVLAFDADDKQFYGRYPGFVTSGPTGTGGASAEMTFQVTLPTGEFDLMVTANANSLLGTAAATAALVKGTSQATVIEAIRGTMGTSGWDVTTPAPLPMWGYKTGVEISETSTSLVDPIHLTRMVARVDIQLGAALIAADKFELQSVRVYNYVEQGRLVPDIAGANAAVWDGITFAELEAITVPTLPSGYTRAASASEWIDYTLGAGETALERSIYLFEAPAGVGAVSDKAGYLTNTCIVIGGDYNDSGTPSYYRIDFAQNGAYLPLMRNHSYTITVTDITADGHVSQDDALRSTPVNIEADILDWEENDTSVEGSDGLYKLKVSRGTFAFPWYMYNTTAPVDNELTITTDYSGGWSARVWDNEAGTSASSWLTLSQSSVSAADDPTGTSVRLLVSTIPSTSADRTAWVHVTAGVITLKVKVTQEKAPIPGVRSTGTANGVIGYIWHPGYPDHHKLTMAKDDGEDSDGIVYVAFFEFGSLIAISSENTGAFTANDIVAWPSEWKSTTDDRTELNAFITGTKDAAWDLIPVVNKNDKLTSKKEIGTVSRVKAENGLGDPCQYYAADLGPGWRLPKWNENATFVGQGGTSGNGSAYYNWSPATATDPGLGTFPKSPEGPTTSLPAPGYRAASGVISQPIMGLYLTSTAYSGTAGYTLHVSSSGVKAENGAQFPYGWNVRCIPTVTP